MKTLKHIFKAVLFIFIVALYNISIFIFVMRAEVFPRVQETLVTSAMVTMTHQYLANIIAGSSRINEIMKNNTVLGTNAKTDKTDINIKNTNNNSEGSSSISDTSVTNNVELIDIKGEGYVGHMFIVHNPKTVILGSTKSLGSYGTKLNTLISESNGIGGINASGFVDTGGKGNGGTPTGIVIQDGNIIYKDNGSSYYDLIGIDYDGILTLGRYKLDQIKDLHIRYGVSFFPYLIINGQPTKIIGDGGWGINPRSAIGQKADGSIILLEIDGRQIGSVGATIKELQRVMIEQGAVNAANLDGGSSTVMYYQDKLINKPCSPYGERPLPNAWIIAN